MVSPLTTDALLNAVANDVKSHPLAPTVQFVAADTGMIAVTITRNSTKRAERHPEQIKPVFIVIFTFSTEKFRRNRWHNG
nr:hypothetical protein [uncultured Methanoregula sp.]